MSRVRSSASRPPARLPCQAAVRDEEYRDEGRGHPEDAEADVRHDGPVDRALETHAGPAVDDPVALLGGHRPQLAVQDGDQLGPVPTHAEGKLEFVGRRGGHLELFQPES